MDLYDTFFKWAYSIGMTIRKAPSKNCDELLRKLIFSIRAEETPGRFFDKLSQTITEYRTNRNIALDVHLHPDLFSYSWAADKFHYLKSAILTGLLNALATGGEDE